MQPHPTLMPRPRSKALTCAKECGAEHAKWQGQCHACGRVEQPQSRHHKSCCWIRNIPSSPFAGVEAQIQKLSEVEALDTARIGSGFNELDDQCSVVVLCPAR